jgi:small subunit ribosomal protein S6
MIRNYETVFVCSPDLPAEKITDLKEKVKSIIIESGGSIKLFDEWGKKRLAYPISGKKEGIYFYIDFSAEGNVIKKLENFYLVSEGIIRYLTVKKNKPTQKDKKEKIPEQMPESETKAERNMKNGTENKIA